MLLCDLGALEAPEGPLTDPATIARACAQRADRLELGRALSGARARNGARSLSAHRSQRARPVAHRAPCRSAAQYVYARKNIFRGKVQNECFY